MPNRDCTLGGGTVDKKVAETLYAGAKRSGTIWHLSWLKGEDPNRRALCGHKTTVEQEVIIPNYGTLDDLLKDKKTRLCKGCAQAAIWPRIARN